jgi:hypothetical protein
MGYPCESRTRFKHIRQCQASRQNAAGVQQNTGRGRFLGKVGQTGGRKGRLRHYHISRTLMVALPMQMIAESCGTSVRMIETHYGKLWVSDRQQMVDLIALQRIHIRGSDDDDNGSRTLRGFDKSRG